MKKAHVLLRAGAVIITEARAACGRGMLRVKNECVSLLVLFLKSPIPRNLVLPDSIDCAWVADRRGEVSPYLLLSVRGGRGLLGNKLFEGVFPRRVRVLINDTWTSRLWSRGDCGCSRSCVRH